MKLNEYMNVDKLAQEIANKYINVRNHPTLPLRVFNYSHEAQFDQHWTHEVCACRGLIVDDEDNIISRPFYKFFNLDQKSTILGSSHSPHEAQEGVMVDSDVLLKTAKFYTTQLSITRKMDGQFGCLWNYGDQWGIATRGAFESDGAKFATEKFQKFVKYGAAQDFIPKGWTLVWEIIAKHLKIVIDYPWEGICLLGAIHNETGEEMSYDQLHKLWVNLNSYSKTLDKDGNTVTGKPWCRIVEKVDIDLATAEADQSKDEEGYVATVPRYGIPPLKVKIKLAEYRRVHKILTNTTPQMLWTALADPTAPWLRVHAYTDRQTGKTVNQSRPPADFVQWVQQWQRGLTNAFHENLLLAINAAADLKLRESDQLRLKLESFKQDAERKKWLVAYGYSNDIANAAMLLYNEKIVEAYEVLWKLVRPHGKDEKFFVEGKGE